MDDDEEGISCRYLVQPLNRKTSKVKINILQTYSSFVQDIWYGSKSCRLVQLKIVKWY